MDAPESSVNRIGRTIWTVWGYLSGAVARYLRPEVTDEGNQSAHYRSHEIDLKTTANKINKEVKANNSEEEEKKRSQNDKSTAEVKCSLPGVREQVASVAWENTDVVKDDNNDELHVDTSRKQTVSCAVWSTGTGDHGARVSGDSESEGRKSGERVENEVVTIDEGQAERSNAKTECKESETAQELDETGHIEQKRGDDEECDQKREDEKCSKKREYPDNADVAVQSELYGEDVEQVNMTGHGKTESLGGFKHADEHLIDEMETNVGQIDREKTKIDKNQRTQSVLPELECSTKEADGLSMPEGLKVLEKYSDEIAEFSKNEVEEMIPGKRDGIESEQDTTKFELLDSVEMLQEVSKEISEKNVSNNETELKITSVLDEFHETVNASEDALQLDSKQDTPQNISETGTGSPVVAIKSECMFSDLIVCEFPGELRKGPETALAETDLGCFGDIKINLHEPQSLAEEQTERETFVAHCVEHSETQEAVEEAVETEQDIETPIKSLGATESQTHQEIDETKFPLKEHVELRTELVVETTETNINTEDEEAEPFKTQSQSSNIRNVTFQTHELLEFTEGQCKLSQETMDTFSESLGNSGVSEITGTAEIDHVSEDQTDGKPVLTRTLSPAEFLEETLDLQGESERCIEEQETLDTEVVKTALEFVEEITNQVFKEMIDAAINFETAKTESLAGLSAEEHSVEEPEECVSAGAFVLEEERKLLGETMGSTVEMEVETAIREVAKQNEQHISSPEFETTEADGYHEQEPYLCADHEESISCDAESEHVENEVVSADEGQAENVNANSECKESETAQELDETEQIEQKHGDNEQYDQKREDEKCARKRKDPNVQSELYGQDVEEEKQIIMMDHGETESIRGFKHADEHLIDEKDDHETTEIDENQGPELQVPADAFVLEEERKLLGQTMVTGLELEVENTSSEVAKQKEQHISSPECETTEADGHHEQELYLCAGTDHEESISCDAESEGYKGDAHVENEAISTDEGQAENVEANSECKESETAQELAETEQIEQKHGDNEENDQKLEDEKCARKREDPDNTDVQSELYGQDVEQEKRIIVMDHGETESFGGFKHADERLIDDHEKTEIDEDQGPELQVPADAFVLEEERKLLGETMDTGLELEVENTSSEVAKQNEQHISSPECETTEADGRHERIQKVTAAETVLSSPEDLMEISRPVMKRGFDRVSEDLPEVKIEGDSDWDLQAFEDSSLDFTIQKSRIAVKNPLVRPPKDPRKLLYMVSVEPLLPQPPPCAQKVEVSVPSKGLVGFKLPGLGAGLPALRKTEFGKKAREEGEAEHTLHPQQKSVAVTEDSVKQEQASAKPKWTPPKHPGMASPLMMAELKTKLKKPVKE